jgi:hypothetical protein
VVAHSAEEFVDAERAGSGSYPVDYLTLAVPADSVAPTEDAHFVRAAQLADLALADSLAVPALAGAVVPPGDAHSAQVARLDGSARGDWLAASAPADAAALPGDAHSAQVAQLDGSARADSLAVTAPADAAVLPGDAHSARAAQLDGSARGDWLAVSAPADAAVLPGDAHSARAAQLDGSARGDWLAASVLADSVAPMVDARSARAARLDDSARRDWVVALVPADSVAPMMDGSAEQDWPLPDVHSPPAGCSGGLLAGSQVADCRVALVWQRWVGSADSLDVPCWASLPCPEAPASPLVASRAHSLDASSELHGSLEADQDVLPEPVAALRKRPEAVVVLPWRSPAGSPLLLAARLHGSHSQLWLQARSLAWEQPQPSN